MVEQAKKLVFLVEEFCSNKKLGYSYVDFEGYDGFSIAFYDVDIPNVSVCVDYGEEIYGEGFAVYNDAYGDSLDFESPHKMYKRINSIAKKINKDLFGY